MIFCETKEPLSSPEAFSGDKEKAASLSEAPLPEGRQENMPEEQREGLPLSEAAPEPSPAAPSDGEPLPDPGAEEGEDTLTDGGDVPEETEVIGVRFRTTGKITISIPAGPSIPRAATPWWRPREGLNTAT